MLSFYNAFKNVYYYFKKCNTTNYNGFLQEPLVLTTLISLFVRLHSIVRVSINTPEIFLYKCPVYLNINCIVMGFLFYLKKG